MELLSVIRRWHYRDHFSIREIPRRTGLSRNTVRKYLRSDTVEPKFNIPDRPSKLDLTPTSYRRCCGRKRGSRESRSGRPSNCTPIWPPSATTAPTIAWRPSLATGRPPGSRNSRRAAAACSCRLCFCRARRSSSTGRKIGRSSPASGPNCRSLTSSSPTAAPSFSAPILSRPTRCCSTPTTTLPRLGGRAAAGHLRQYANGRRQGRPRKGTPSQRALLSHGQPLSVRSRVLQSGLRVGEGADREKRPGRAPSALAAHAALPLSRCAKRLAGDALPRALGIDAARLTSWHGRRCLGEEAQHLMSLSRTFDGFVEYAKRVSPTFLIHLDRNRYSVPASFANRPVSVRVYPERIVVVGEGQIVCEHRRVFARSHQRKSTTTVFDWRHYLAVVQRKPGALRNGGPFAELPPAFRALQQRMLKTPGGDREMVEILALVLQHDEQAVFTAVELALEAGAPTKTHILNLLHRLVDGKPTDTPTIKAPQALTLTTEPQSNVERYDALRKVREARHAS